MTNLRSRQAFTFTEWNNVAIIVTSLWDMTEISGSIPGRSTALLLCA